MPKPFAPLAVKRNVSLFQVKWRWTKHFEYSSLVS